MKNLISLLAIFSFSFSVNGSPVNSTQLTLGALYIMNNAPSGNYIISAAIGLGGKLTAGTAISAQGAGGFPDIPVGDPLASQDSMVVVGNRLYAVNAGSNTISAFSINVLCPTELTLIGKPVSSGGPYPVSIAVSPRTGQVCVLNAGVANSTINGVNCFKPDSRLGLVEIPGTNRQLGQTIVTNPIGLLGAPSSLSFSEDGSVLYAVVKGIPTIEPGFIAAWTVNSVTGALSENFVKSPTPFNGGLPFAMLPIPGTNAAIVPDVVEGYEIFEFSTPTSVATSTAFPIPGQVAVCWVRRSEKTKNFYLSDFGTGIVTEVHIDNKLQNTIVQQYSLGATAGIDEEIIGTIAGQDYLYVLAAGVNSTFVLSLEAPGKALTIQQFDFSAFASDEIVIDPLFTQGIAIYNS